MKTCPLACCFLLLTIAAAPRAVAQEEAPLLPLPQDALINDLTPQQMSRQQRTHAFETSEDLAVMAAILRENLLELYGGPHSLLGGQSARVASPLGERLPGYGVILQVQVPAPRMPAHKDQPQDKPALSRWERTQRRLRGEPVPPREGAQVCAQCHDAQAIDLSTDTFWYGSGSPPVAVSPSGAEDLIEWTIPHVTLGVWAAGNYPTKRALVDALIDTLAENGAHFRNLAADEHVALSVSFQLATAADNRHAADAERNLPSELQLTFTEDGTLTSNNQELTGDLLVKQGQYARAIEAYRRVLEQAPQENTGKPVKDWPEPHRRALLKLIEAWVAAGQQRQVPQALLDIARNAADGNEGSAPAASGGADDVIVRRVFLDVFGLPPTPADYRSLGEGEERIRNLTKLVATALRGKPAASGAAGRLPVRIRVSATKGALDALANGTLTRQEFLRKVETSIVDPSGN